MIVTITLLLFAVGTSADPLLLEPAQSLQDRSEFTNYSNHGPKQVILQDQPVLQADQEYGHESEITNERSGQLKVKNVIPKVSKKVKTECFHPFVNVGEKCYYFSDELLTFSEAQEYCQIISHGHQSQVSLLMLEHSEAEDVAILGAVAERNIDYWVGASSNDGVNWNYVDGRAVDLMAQFWLTTEPNTADNRCVSTYIAAHGNYKNAYIADELCSESLNFICETQTVCPADFEFIDGYCYMQSVDIGLPKLSWSMARDYCNSMTTPLGYHSDLAVLGLSGQDTSALMSTFASVDTDKYIWVGGSATSNCTYQWVDGRIIPSSSFRWYVNRPSNCVSTQRVALVYESAYKYRSWLVNRSEASAFHFVCQMFKQT